MAKWGTPSGLTTGAGQVPGLPCPGLQRRRRAGGRGRSQAGIGPLIPWRPCVPAVDQGHHLYLFSFHHKAFACPQPLRRGCPVAPSTSWGPHPRPLSGTAPPPPFQGPQHTEGPGSRLVIPPPAWRVALTDGWVPTPGRVRASDSNCSPLQVPADCPPLCTRFLPMNQSPTCAPGPHLWGGGMGCV